MKRFEVIEHTADIGLKIYGRDLRELFLNASLGLFSLLTDLKKVITTDKIEVNLKEDNREELLVSWINELIFQFSARSFITKKIKISEITDNKISANLFGERIDLSRHKILTEIKAATYHELKIDKTQKGFQAQVILDT